MYYENNNIKIYYEKHGNGKKNILILPGWGNTRETFKYLIDFLKINYTVYIIDYPGFGNSPTLNKELTIYDYASLIKNLLKKLKITNPIIIAHSFGGRITSILQGKYKIPLEKIVLIDVAGIKRRKKISQYLREKLYKLLKKATFLLPKNKRKKYRHKLLQYFGSEDYKSIPPSMQKTFQNIVNENLKLLYKNITTETLIIWGEKDDATPLKDGILINKLIKDSAIIVYKNSNHFSYLDNPLLTSKIIEEFIKK